MTYTIKKVETKKEARIFTDLPVKLFGHIDAFVPALAMDEMNVFDPKKNPAHEYCDSVRFLAYNEKKEVVGRIGGIINHKYNEAKGTKIVRFTRLDMIDDIEVTKLLLQAVINWGHEQGLNHMIGPIGFTDMDRMGMLIEGFEQLGTFITIWNPPYYKEHLENLGFEKDVDWIETKIQWPTEVPERISRGVEVVKQRYGYKLVKLKSIKELDKYVYDAFDVYNEAFNHLYGFFPVTRAVEDYYIKQMKSLVVLKYLWFVTDANDKVVGFGLMMPSLAMANKKNKGKLFPFGWIRILRAIKKYDVVDFYFIAVDPKHQNHGVLAFMIEDGIKLGIQDGVKFAETGPELEHNRTIQAQWAKFDLEIHKRRRCWKKDI